MYREVKWRGGTVRLAKIDNISHLLLFQVMSLKKCIQADEAWSFRQYGGIGSIALSKACTSDSGK